MLHIVSGIRDFCFCQIEILVYCPLTSRQKMMYQAVKNKIRIEDLLQSGAVPASATSSLMNLVMQFRKVQAVAAACICLTQKKH